jgi:hypothetical protein
MSVNGLKDDFVPRFISNGEDKFYRSLLYLALNKLVLINRCMYKGSPPHLEYLDYYDSFIILHRREGDEVYLRIAKILRKASHRIYRIMLKKKMTSFSTKFLNLV